MIRTLTVGASVLAAAVLGAVPAHADQWDYVSDLDNHGVSYNNMDGVINDGKAICHDLRMGLSITPELNALTSLNFSMQEAAIILVSASHNMCPDTWARVVTYANNRGDYTPPAPLPAPVAPAEQVANDGES